MITNDTPELHATVTNDATPPRRPTHVRYGVLAFLCTLALLLYADRICIGQAATSMQSELHLSKTQMSWVFNAFTLAYCLFEVPTGHWGDRFGSRGVITRIAVCWSIFTALTGAAIGMGSLVAIRFLFGAGEAGAFPNSARVITRWIPERSRGFARGSITFVSMVGATLAPIAAAFLIQRVGWRLTFAIFGAVGVAWAIAFHAWFRDSPAQHGGANEAELELIGVNAPHAGPHRLAIPWDRVLASANVWLLGAIMSAFSILFYMLFQWFPTYLKEARGQDESATGWLSGCVMAGGAAGCIAGGLLADAVLRHTRERRWSQSLCGAAMLFMSAASVAAIRYMPSAGMVTLCGASAMFFVQASLPTWWTVVAQISGRHGAAMWGLMNSLGGFGGMGATYFVGWYLDHAQHSGRTALDAWRWVFEVVSMALAAGAICWLVVNSTRSVVERLPNKQPISP